MLVQTPPLSHAADMKALEEEVRAIHKDGLLWGACKFGCTKTAMNCCLLLCLGCISALWLNMGCQYTQAPVMFPYIC